MMDCKQGLRSKTFSQSRTHGHTHTNTCPHTHTHRHTDTHTPTHTHSQLHKHTRARVQAGTCACCSSSRTRERKTRFAKEGKNKVFMAESLVVSSRVNHHCANKDILRRESRKVRRKYCLAYRQGAVEIDTREM